MDSPRRDPVEKKRRRRSHMVHGELLRSLRLQRGWSQKEAGLHARLSDKTINTAEAGGPLEIHSIKALGTLYGVDSDSLISQTSTPPKFMPATEPPRSPAAAMAKRYLEGIWNHGQFELIDELFLPEFRFYNESGVVRNREELRQRVIMLRRSFSDFHFVVTELCDHVSFVVCRWEVDATHSGDWMDLPATNRRVRVYGSSWVQIVNGRFGDAWDFWDPSQLNEQLR